MTHHPPNLTPNPETVSALRQLVDAFIKGSLKDKLDKLDKLKNENVEQRQLLMQKHQPVVWLADAARRAMEIQLATHTLKPIHPDARGSTIYRDPGPVSDPVLVASHVVLEPVDDVVGNAAALAVYKLLKLSHAGESLLLRARRRDVDFQAALTHGALPEAGQAATEWIASFAALAEASSEPASHSLAKQLYFPLGDGNYHLLAPLFPTTLVHEWHGRQISDRFSDATKAAKDARRSETRPNDGKGYRDYPGLAVQKFGGTNPQNISQLNSKRVGAAHLFSALPPVWRSAELNALMKTSSVFTMSGVLFWQFEKSIKTLRQFLVFVNKGANKQRSILEWRQARSARIDQLIDDIQAWAATVQMSQPGWSLRADCLLSDDERQWLDPHAPQALDDKARAARAQAYADRAAMQPELSDEDCMFDFINEEEEKAEAQAEAKALDIDQQIAKTFAGWLNALLTTKDTQMDNATHREWVQRWQALPAEKEAQHAA